MDQQINSFFNFQTLSGSDFYCGIPHLTSTAGIILYLFCATQFWPVPLFEIKAYLHKRFKNEVSEVPD